MRCGKCEKELHACECVKKKDEPVIDKSMAKRIATQLGWEPKKEWVGLTNEEIKDILDCGRGGLVDIKKAEQKLKEKNNG